MRKIVLVALVLMLMASLGFAQKKPKATHPPVVKHHIDKTKIGKHVKPNHPKVKHASEKHPKAVHPMNENLKHVKAHKAKDTKANREASKSVLKASKKSKRRHKFLFF
jgi:hypothetical protein